MSLDLLQETTSETTALWRRQSSSSTRVAEYGTLVSKHQTQATVTIDPHVPQPREQTSRPSVWRADRWASSGTFWVEDYRVSHVEPLLIVDPSAQPLLSFQAKTTVNWLLTALKRAAIGSFVRLERIEISGYIDPEYADSDEIVITQWVALPAEDAMRYWGKLGGIVEAWISSLPEDLARIAHERIAIDLRWRD